MKLFENNEQNFKHVERQRQKVALDVVTAAKDLKYPVLEFFCIREVTWQHVQACAAGEPCKTSIDLLMALAGMLDIKYECLATVKGGKKEWMKD